MTADYKRVSLIDPLLYQSTYINPDPPKPLKINFWKKFNPWNFFFNIALPIFIFIFILFVLKEKYLSKRNRLATNKTKEKNLFPKGIGNIINIQHYPNI